MCSVMTHVVIPSMGTPYSVQVSTLLRKGSNITIIIIITPKNGSNATIPQTAKSQIICSTEYVCTHSFILTIISISAQKPKKKKEIHIHMYPPPSLHHHHYYRQSPILISHKGPFHKPQSTVQRRVYYIIHSINNVQLYISLFILSYFINRTVYRRI